jgi:hypothetical protein
MVYKIIIIAILMFSNVASANTISNNYLVIEVCKPTTIKEVLKQFKGIKQMRNINTTVDASGQCFTYEYLITKFL